MPSYEPYEPVDHRRDRVYRYKYSEYARRDRTLQPHSQTQTQADPELEKKAHVAAGLYNSTNGGRVENLLGTTRDFLKYFKSVIDQSGGYSPLVVFLNTKKDPELFNKFDVMRDNIVKAANNCKSSGRSAETVLHAAEIVVALSVEPVLIGRCVNPAAVLQNNPGICDLNFVKSIEDHNSQLSPEALKQIRRTLLQIQDETTNHGFDVVSKRPNISSGGRIIKREAQEFFIGYMLNPFDAELCMESVRMMPYSIKSIKPQSEALQETALREGFKSRCVLATLYAGFINPSPRIQEMYKDAQELMSVELSEAKALELAKKHGLATNILKNIIKWHYPNTRRV